MKSNFGNLLIVIIAFVGGFIILNKENKSEYIMPDVIASGAGLADISVATLGKVGEFTKGMVVDKASIAFDVVSDKADELMKGIVNSAETKALNSLKAAVDKTFENVADGIGVDLNTGGSSQANIILNPIGFSIRSDVPAYFTIKNKEAGSVAYEINWKDGKIEKGQINKGETKVVSHSWSSSGEYVIRFKITSEKSVREYEISISII